jgi:hypothetical protein
MHPTTSPAPAFGRGVPAAWHEYRSSMERSLEAARGHDQLRHRLHAFDSARALLRLLFDLEGRSAPDVDELPGALAGLEAAQDWPAGYLRWALLNLVQDPAPKRQLELARRVDRLLSGRGFGEPADIDGPKPASAVERQLTAGGVHRAP